jgi:hypothetical protein
VRGGGVMRALGSRARERQGGGSELHHQVQDYQLRFSASPMISNFRSKITWRSALAR